MDCSPPGSSVHGILQARILREGCHFLLQGIFLTQGLKPHPLHLLALAGGFFTSESPGISRTLAVTSMVTPSGHPYSHTHFYCLHKTHFHSSLRERVQRQSQQKRHTSEWSTVLFSTECGPVTYKLKDICLPHTPSIYNARIGTVNCNKNPNSKERTRGNQSSNPADCEFWRPHAVSFPD